ncbi:MAG: lytic transglycosylase domain-containing protein [Myxococcota bacterium]
MHRQYLVLIGLLTLFSPPHGLSPERIPRPQKQTRRDPSPQAQLGRRVQDEMPAVSPCLEASPDGLLSDEEARCLYRGVFDQVAQGTFDTALRDLSILEDAFPEIIDRFALLRGQILLHTQQPADACEALRDAATSPLSAIRVHAAVERARCLVRAGYSWAESELRALGQTYPALPSLPLLHLEYARHQRDQGSQTRAALVARDIVMLYPGSKAAAQAEELLGSVDLLDVELEPMSLSQQVERMVRWTRTGPIQDAARAIEDLWSRHESSLSEAERARLLELRFNIARRAGRYEQAHDLLKLALSTPIEDQELRESLIKRRNEVQNAIVRIRTSEYSDSALIDKNLSTGSNHLAAVARNGRRRDVNRLIERQLEQPLSPEEDFEYAMIVKGTASDDLTVALLDRVLSEAQPKSKLGIAARYHRASLLHREAPVEAAQEFRTLQRSDQTTGQLYALLARQYLPEDEGIRSRGGRERRDYQDTSNLTTISNSLSNAALRAGNDYPFIARARVLLRLGESRGATEELRETFLAWHNGRSDPFQRDGLEAVCRGGERENPVVRGPDTLTRGDRRTLATAAKHLGDIGTALAFGHRFERYPRAYREIVAAASARHGVDEDLIYAIMRKESLYRATIVSSVGAIGLMQIMPRTARSVAEELDIDFDVTDLLDPATNIDIGTWYLKSLLHRFDNSMPLAIAAYNGGPHNVRRWLASRSSTMQVDAFIELIPFEQTHRYVRLVLAFYERYRTERGRAMVRLSPQLPPVRSDDLGF